MIRILFWACLALLMWAPATWAGTLCGTVRDEQTLYPIPSAGIFVFQDGGEYTGIYGASDVNGWFCIDPIDAGVYDLQVRVDGHRTLWVEDVAVAGTPTGIDLIVTAMTTLRSWPNPASNRVHLDFNLEKNGPVRLEVFSARGHRVFGWEGEALAGETGVSWNLRDGFNRPLPSGIYFVRLAAGRVVAVKKLIVSR